ncbi:MAG: polysaccharide deacetylase family protein [Candidatus Binatia bacterium]
MTGHFPILTFHAVDDRASVISFPPSLFERGMARLYHGGYRTISLPELAGCLCRGTAFPERSFAITFDDGYQSVYDGAFPILQRYGFSATVFLAVGENTKCAESERLPSMCERSMLSWREIREMQRSGIDFGGHTLTHPDLTRLPPEHVEREVVNGKSVIEDALSVSVAGFAYPFGRYDDRCREVVSRHFVCACSDKLELIRHNSDVYAMERVDAYYLRSDRSFGAMLTRLFPLYIGALAIPRRVRRSVQEHILRKISSP